VKTVGVGGEEKTKGGAPVKEGRGGTNGGREKGSAPTFLKKGEPMGSPGKKALMGPTREEEKSFARVIHMKESGVGKRRNLNIHLIRRGRPYRRNL